VALKERSMTINPNTPRGAKLKRDMETLQPLPAEAKKAKKKAKKKTGTSTTE
jgi:hypothetical protein